MDEQSGGTALSGEVIQTRWKSRIVGDGWEPPDQLLANPFNFRVHSLYQQQVVETLLDRIGWIQRVIVNVNPDPRCYYHMIDGHLRVKKALQLDEPVVPVTYVNLALEDEITAILFFDKSSSLAVIDPDVLRELAEDYTPQDEVLEQLLSEMVGGSTLESLLTTPEPKKEEAEVDPETAVVVEIQCTFRDLEEFQATLQKWNQRPSVSISYS